MANPSSHPYTHEVDCALQPHIKLLTKLLHEGVEDLSCLSERDIPALQFVRKNRLSQISAARTGIIPLVGDLDVMSRAQIHNWIYVNVPGASKTFHEWIGKLVVAHCITLVLAYRLRSEEAPEDKDLLQQAWRIQTTADEVGERIVPVDVDLECLRALEERMFECSEKAGEAGFQQWGLDAGDHQDAWDPYLGIPSDWDNGWQPEDPEESLAVSTDLCSA